MCGEARGRGGRRALEGDQAEPDRASAGRLISALAAGPCLSSRDPSAVAGDASDASGGAFSKSQSSAADSLGAYARAWLSQRMHPDGR